MLRSIVLLMILMSSVAFAQRENVSGSEAVKIDEFGPLGHCDLTSRLDNFLVGLMEKPNAKGYIIFYQGKDVLPSQLENPSIENLYLSHINYRRFDSSRITLISSFRNEMATELWLVPENAEPPKPTGTIPKPEISLDKTLLYGEGSIDSFNDSENYDDLLLPHKKAVYEEPAETVEVSEASTVEPDEEEPKLSAEELENIKFQWADEKFGKFLEKNKKMQGVIIFYADDQEIDFNRLTNHVEEGKNRIARAANISPEKIKVIFGGYKRYIQMEFWAVPEKGKFPEPTPEERVIEDENETGSEVETSNF